MDTPLIKSKRRLRIAKVDFWLVLGVIGLVGVPILMCIFDSTIEHKKTVVNMKRAQEIRTLKQSTQIQDAHVEVERMKANAATADARADKAERELRELKATVKASQLETDDLPIEE